MRGYLFDDYTVDIDERSVALGGSWQGAPRDGMPTAWDGDLLRFFYGKMTPGCRFLDIGANTGSYCLLCALVPDARCEAFEPQYTARQVLQSNIDRNNLGPYVNASWLALWDTNGNGYLACPPSGASGLACLAKDPTRFRPASIVQVQLRKLDNVGIAQIDLMKIDVEGAELMVLRGAEQTLRREHPGLLVEYDERNVAAFGYDRSEIVTFLRDVGYSHFTFLGPDGRDLWAT